MANMKPKILVVDTGAFVKNVPLWEHGEILVTVNDTLKEIKDNQTKQYMSAFPVTINYEEPKAESLHFMSGFTKKTGDYHCLSVTDLKLLALTYEIEVAAKGSDHLRSEPIKRIVNTQVSVPVSQLNEENEAREEQMDTEASESNSQQNGTSGEKESNEEEEEDDGWTVIKRRKQTTNTDTENESAKDTASVVSVASSMRSRKDGWRPNMLPGFYVAPDPEQKISSIGPIILGILEDHLTVYSYIDGFQPCKDYELIVLMLLDCFIPSTLTRHASQQQWGNVSLFADDLQLTSLKKLLYNHERSASSCAHITGRNEKSIIGGTSSIDKIPAAGCTNGPVSTESVEMIVSAEDNSSSSSVADSSGSDAGASDSSFDKLEVASDSSSVEARSLYPSIQRWLRHMLSAPWEQHRHNSDTACQQVGPGSDLLLAIDQAIAIDEEDDGEEGWVTPENIDEKFANYYKQSADPSNSFSDEEEEKEDEQQPEVACITADFAMQNVLRHIGLAVLGVDGKLIKQARNYVLRCYACYSVTPDMSKLFCPRCGNRTLKRVSMTIDADGKQHIWISRKPLSIRGTKFNLPRPRGGHHALMPLLTSDQRFPQQWAKKKKAVDALDPDYIARSSPFSTHDLYSRAAQHGYYSGQNAGIKGQLRHARIWKPKKGKMVKK